MQHLIIFFSGISSGQKKILTRPLRVDVNDTGSWRRVSRDFIRKEYATHKYSIRFQEEFIINKTRNCPSRDFIVRLKIHGSLECYCRSIFMTYSVHEGSSFRDNSVFV